MCLIPPINSQPTLNFLTTVQMDFSFMKDCEEILQDFKNVSILNLFEKIIYFTPHIFLDPVTTTMIETTFNNGQIHK